MLEVEVRHDINKNYLIICGQQEGNYMVQMLNENKIKGFLDMEVREIDNERKYYYDITGKETLVQKTTREKWKHEEFVKLVAGILEAVGKAREYLLSEEHFLLEPEYIYREMNTGEVFLCYAWSQNKNINEQLTQLFSYFLNAVDYEDKQAVQLVYKFYEVSREKQCTLQRLWSVFETEGRESPGVEDKRYYEDEKQVPVTGMEEESNKLSKRKLWMGKTEERGSQTGERKKRKVQKLKPERDGTSFFGKIQKFREKLSRETDESEIAKKNVISRTKDEVGKVKKEEKQSVSLVKKETTKMPFPDEEHTQLIRQNQTAFYSVEKEQQIKKVYKCHLFPKDERQSTISMEEFPFYIGRFQKDTNVLKDIVSISRIHCKIEQSGGRYYVSDLHSTNGTYVNQMKLEEGNKKELREGDELSIADIKYRFSL